MKKSWISIYDNSSEGRFVYVSESVTDYLGWLPEDIIGVRSYNLIHKGDHESIRKVHKNNVFNEQMSTLQTYRHLCKDGSFVSIEALAHYCYDLLVTTNYIFEENSLEHKMRVNSVDEVYYCLPDGTLQFAGGKARKNANNQDSWVDTRVIKSQERRFVLILNRFSENANIVFVSNLASELVSLDVSQCIGQSFYDFIPMKEQDSLKAQVELSKQYGMAIRLRFNWIIDVEKGHLEPMEATASCADDGLVMVVRLAPRLSVAT